MFLYRFTVQVVGCWGQARGERGAGGRVQACKKGSRWASSSESHPGDGAGRQQYTRQVQAGGWVGDSLAGRVQVALTGWLRLRGVGHQMQGR